MRRLALVVTMVATCGGPAAHHDPVPAVVGAPPVTVTAPPLPPTSPGPGVMRERRRLSATDNNHPVTVDNRVTLSSTEYCEQGTMADGRRVHDGAVSSKVLPRGSKWHVLTGPYAGRVLTVEDTGSLAFFDIANPGHCAEARAYGRRDIQIEAA